MESPTSTASPTVRRSIFDGQKTLAEHLAIRATRLREIGAEPSTSPLATKFEREVREGKRTPRAPYLMERLSKVPVPRPDKQAARPRQAHGSSSRVRGSRRGTGSRGDPDDSDGDPDPPGLAPPDRGDDKAERQCLCGCGSSLADRKGDCEFVDDTHSKRFRRAEAKRAADRRRQRPSDQPALSGCSCSSAAVPDPDGQPICLACGRPKGDSPPVNGYDHRAAEMARERGTFHLRDGQREARSHRRAVVV